MGELQEKYREIVEKEKAVIEEPKAAETTNRSTISEKPVVIAKDDLSIAVPKSRGMKRTRYTFQSRRSMASFLTDHSDVMEPADKENTSVPVHDIPNPKKRTKVAKWPSRQVTNPSTVLSPKSANSRTLPQSPVRPALCSPRKSYLSHPASPLKHLSPVKIASPAKAVAATANLASMVGERPKVGRSKAGTTRKASNPATTRSANPRTKRSAGHAHEPEDVRKVSNTSNLSSASVGTTIVNIANKAPTAASKKKNLGVRAVGKRNAAGAEAPASGRRVLRKRA